MYSIEELANNFRKLGIRAGDTAMLHASVRAVGEVAGGPDHRRSQSGGNTEVNEGGLGSDTRSLLDGRQFGANHMSKKSANRRLQRGRHAVRHKKG